MSLLPLHEFRVPTPTWHQELKFLPFLILAWNQDILEKFWFLTAEILELLRILDSCLNQNLKDLNSRFLSWALKIHRAVLWLSTFFLLTASIYAWSLSMQNFVVLTKKKTEFWTICWASFKMEILTNPMFKSRSDLTFLRIIFSNHPNPTHKKVSNKQDRAIQQKQKLPVYLNKVHKNSETNPKLKPNKVVKLRNTEIAKKVL